MTAAVSTLSRVEADSPTAFPPAALAAELLQTCAGGAAVIDILPNEGGDAPRAALLYALGLLLRTGRGRIYPYSTFRRWLREGGFEDTSCQSLIGAFPLSLITARRR